MLEQVGDVATLTLGTPIPEDVLFNNRNLIFTVTASQLGYSAAKAAIIISLSEGIKTFSIAFIAGRNFQLMVISL